MSRKPEFITFTGADDHTNIADMIELSRYYPVEWGILFSTERQGIDPRYPHTASRLQFNGGRFSAHLCGSLADDIMHGRNYPGIDPTFQRVQINHKAPAAAAVSRYSDWISRICIAQSRDLHFPRDTSIDWLFDTSGGRGNEPHNWPHYPHRARLVGYAGGIGPHNVTTVIDAIDASGPYWIDMESGVRTDDRFDLNLCKQVCISVYGQR